MRERPTVSVVVATFNGERFLSEQLTSILLQTRLPDEVVISDDVSIDATLSIAESFARSAPFPVNILRNTERLGCALNFDRAMRSCFGDLVFLADQDDVWFPEKIEAMVAFANGNDSLSVVHNIALADEHLVPAGQTILDRLALLGLSADQHIKGCCTMVSRELLDMALPIPAGVGHDNYLNTFARRLGRLSLNRDVLMKYRIHGGNTSRWPVNSLREIDWRVRAELRLRGHWNRLRLFGRRSSGVDLGSIIDARLAALGFSCDGPGV